jgi:hypothetical protein
MTPDKNQSLQLLNRTQLLPTFPYLRANSVILDEKNPTLLAPATTILLLDIHETGKECSVTSVKVSRNTAKVSSKGKGGTFIQVTEQRKGPKTVTSGSQSVA